MASPDLREPTEAAQTTTERLHFAKLGELPQEPQDPRYDLQDSRLKKPRRRLKPSIIPRAAESRVSIPRELRATMPVLDPEISAEAVVDDLLVFFDASVGEVEFQDDEIVVMLRKLQRLYVLLREGQRDGDSIFTKREFDLLHRSMYEALRQKLHVFHTRRNAILRQMAEENLLAPRILAFFEDQQSMLFQAINILDQSVHSG